MRRRPATASVLMLSVLLAGCSAGEPTPVPVRVAEAPFVLTGVADLEEVAQLTGPDSMNKTDRWAVAGTDLGSMFNVDDRTYFVFGDTFGERREGMTGGGGEDWRSNVLAVSTDADPSDGISFDRFIADDADHAKELIPAKRQDGIEITRIPTHGIAAGSALYLYYMSVRHWGPAGEWDANHSGVARSTDEGETWQVLDGLEWDGESNFIQVSPFKVTKDDGSTEVYFWGIPAGRFGGVKLMKVPEAEIERLDSYRYFAGTEENGTPAWSAEIADAETIVDDTVGELSVAWNDYLERWVMTYLRGGGDLVIREGINPWGPWREPITVATQTSHPGLYGPFMNPRYVENGGETIYFSLSRWGPYQVFWMKLSLVKDEA